MENKLTKYEKGFLVLGKNRNNDEVWKLHKYSTNDTLLFVGFDVALPIKNVKWAEFDSCNQIDIRRLHACKVFTEGFKGKVFMDDVCVSDIWNKDELESDNVVNPNHYKGSDGMMAIDVMKNFMTTEQLEGYYLGNTFKYLLRFQKKNGLEDLYKARQHLDWLISMME